MTQWVVIFHRSGQLSTMNNLPLGGRFVEGGVRVLVQVAVDVQLDLASEFKVECEWISVSVNSSQFIMLP